MLALLIILSISFLILVHEFGHFLAAKISGIRVKEFALGFGPPIISFKHKETRYRVNVILLGGYVKFFSLKKGKTEESQLFEEDELEIKPFRQKLLVVVSGVVANLVAALLILAVLSLAYGTPQALAKLGKIFPNQPAAKAGFRSGDVIVAVNNKVIKTGDELARTIGESTNKKILVEVKRGSQKKVLAVTPRYDPKLKRGIIGVRIETSLKFVREGVIKSLIWAFSQFIRAIGLIFFFLGQLFTAKASIKTLAGPIGMVKISSEVAKFGLFNFIFLQAFISINLAILNLLPLPPLDGGRLLLYVIEAARRKPLSNQTKGAIIVAGVFVLLTLFVFVTYNDISRILTGADFLP